MGRCQPEPVSQLRRAHRLCLSAGQAEFSSPFAFAFNADATLAYLADDTLKGAGGIQRWDLSGSSWTMTYAFTGLTNVGARGLAVDFSGANPILYATTAESSASRLVSITDTGAVSADTTLATSGVNQIIRGVAFAPNAELAPQFYNAACCASGFSLSWTTLINRNYTVQYNDNLDPENWLTLTNLTTTTPVMTILAPPASANASRFYRIVLNF